MKTEVEVAGAAECAPPRFSPSGSSSTSTKTWSVPSAPMQRSSPEIVGAPFAAAAGVGEGAATTAGTVE